MTLELLLRSVAVAAAALGIAATMRRSSASARALVLSLGFTILLLLPLARRLSPAWGPEIAASPTVGLVKTLPPAASFDWLLAVWIAGAAVGLIRTVWSINRLGRVLADCAPAPIHRRGIRILISDANFGPFTCGVLRPTVVLPRESHDWSAERIESIVQHEAAHIERKDWLRLLLVRLVRCLYWPNPLVWAMERRLRLACEQACDDRVIMAGSDAANYAAELVQIAKGRRLPATVSMAEPSSLERRIRSILSDVRRSAPSRRWQAVALTLAFIAATGFGGFELRSRRLRPAIAPKVPAEAAAPLAEHARKLAPTAARKERKPLLIRDWKPPVASKPRPARRAERTVAKTPTPSSVPRPNPPSGTLVPTLAPSVGIAPSSSDPSEAILQPSMPKADEEPTLLPARAGGGNATGGRGGARGGGAFGGGGTSRPPTESTPSEPVRARSKE